MNPERKHGPMVTITQDDANHSCVRGLHGSMLVGIELMVQAREDEIMEDALAILREIESVAPEALAKRTQAHLAAFCEKYDRDRFAAL